MNDDPRAPPRDLAAAVTLLQQGREREARPIIESLAANTEADGGIQQLLGVVRYLTGDAAAAVEALQRAVALGVNDAATFNNLGGALADSGRRDEAVAAYREAIRRAPGLYEPLVNLADTLRDLGRPAEAVSLLDDAVARFPDEAEARSKLGNVLFETGRHEAALRAYEEALERDRNFPFAEGMAFHCRMLLHDWDDFDTRLARLLEGVEAGRPVVSPFILFSLPSTAAQHRQCAETYGRTKFPPPAAAAPTPRAAPRQGRIRLGYVSSDFHEHPVTRLTAELYERHDRSRFELVGLSCGAGPADGLRRRIEAAFDEFHDLRGRSDEDIAAFARALGLDIAIDMTGYTGSLRTGVFTRRIAPVQVGYLGFLGTLGIPCLDYLVADPIVAPPAAETHYSEKLARLPECFLVNGTHRRMADPGPTRKECGLPEDAFVFCCFNNGYKIAPPSFDAWMEILRRTGNGVLWLVAGNMPARQRLRTEAARRGVDPDRLVFASRTSLETYLASYRLADLFLDTFHYSAGTTGADALWSGLPLLTCPTDSFTGRVAASLLHAVGLDDLAVPTAEAYVDTAVSLASDPVRHRDLRRRLAEALPTASLFDVPRWVGHLERAYTMMLERSDAGLAAAHITVSAAPGISCEKSSMAG